MTIDHSEYFRTPKPRPITVPKLHHATFMTMDVDAMVKFYELVCGLQPVYYADRLNAAKSWSYSSPPSSAPSFFPFDAPTFSRKALISALRACVSFRISL